MEYMDKEKWIDKIEDSAKGLVKADPSPFLYDKMVNRIQSGNYSVTGMLTGNPYLRWGLAATISLLIISNLFTVVRTKQYMRSENNTTETGYSIPSQTIYAY